MATLLESRCRGTLLSTEEDEEVEEEGKEEEEKEGAVRQNDPDKRERKD